MNSNKNKSSKSYSSSSGSSAYRDPSLSSSKEGAAYGVATTSISSSNEWSDDNTENLKVFND